MNYITSSTISSFVTIFTPTDFKKTWSLTQLNLMFDILSRKHQHHLALTCAYSPLYNKALLELLAIQLKAEQTPKRLHNFQLIYIDINKLASSNISIENFIQEFNVFCDDLNKQNKSIILAFNQCQPLSETEHTFFTCLGKTFRDLLHKDNWRLLLLVQSDQQKQLFQQSNSANLFTSLKLNPLSTTDALSILKTSREELENYHNIIIPDDAYSYALTMATQYLSGPLTNVDKAFQLLDSTAARAPNLERHDQSAHKPILTLNLLAQTISSWTNIPLSHLQQNKFNAVEFVQNLQKHIFGQDAALNLVGLVLQYARMKLKTKTGTLCNFLFTGPVGVGKTETAYAIAEHLFGHKNALLRVTLNKNFHPLSLKDIRVNLQSEEYSSLNLLEAIQQYPYAVILIEGLDQACANTLNLFQEIFDSGYTIDNHGNTFNFRHAIFIITTTLGSERIINLTQPHAAHDPLQTADLMQLVLNHEHIQHTPQPQHHLSHQELAEEIRPILETHFSPHLLSHLNLIPFTLLDYTSLEKIIRLKLKLLAKQLDTNFGIELTYAPEVIRFLVQETLWQGEQTKSVDKVLDQHLLSCVAHELVLHIDDKNRPKRLLLQLNDAGQVLRCEFIAENEAILFNL
jgi:ATP-dependent Clp protease ATP-binding subunit ClpA